MQTWIIKDLLLLAVFWTCWCALHSILISSRATAFFKRKMGGRYAYFRLFFNLFSIITIIPLSGWYFSMPYPEFIIWKWPWTLVKGALLIVVVFLFYAGAKVYSWLDFLGLRQIQRLNNGDMAEEEQEFIRSGILGAVRHPWYLAALIILWARDLDPQGIVVSVVLSLYILIGARLEERKLTERLGEDYELYKEDVSMFLPLKWLVRRFSGK